MKVKACLRSGFCCSKSPCGYGEVTSDSNPACRFLIREGDNRTLCGKYEEISKDPMSFYSPSFGQGCCMPMFNEDRDKIKKEHHDDKEVYVKIVF
jgi:hypothetical protein